MSLGTVLGGVLAAGVGTTAYATLVERNWFALRAATAPVLAPGSRPLRILQVSDLHLMPGQRRKVEWVRGLARLGPDFVVNSGDNLAHERSVAPLLRAMEPLQEFPGAFVLGSNDYFAPYLKNPFVYLTRRYAEAPDGRPPLPTAELVDGLRAGGWHDLNNTRRVVTVAEQPVELVGVDDPHIDLDRYADVSGPAAPDVAVTVGLVHAPYQRVLDAMVRDGAGLVLAGHTHGGQVAVPFWGALTTNSDLPTDRAKGLSRWWVGAGSAGRGAPPPEGSAWLHVTAGLGTSPKAPVRFSCRPEATLLTLVPRPR